MDQDTPTHQIDSIRFDMYDSEIIKKISACSIIEPEAYPKNSTIPNKNGLHDPLLGISPYDRQSANCTLCGLDNENCPGHFGHVELAVPVYNPFLMKILHRLLNAKCFKCHRLKMRNKEKAYMFLKFILLKIGLIQEANILEGIVYSVEAHSECERMIINFIKEITGQQDNMALEENNGYQRHGSIDTTNTDDTGSAGTNQKVKRKSKKEASEENEELKKMQELMKEKMRIVNLKKLKEILDTVHEKMKINDTIMLQDQDINVQYELK
jgi:DNA-directed RNA polymerase beta' subunit